MTSKTATAAEIARIKPIAPSIAIMFERGMTCVEMDRALGHTCAAAHWLRVNPPQISNRSEVSAKHWLALNPAPERLQLEPATPAPAEADTSIALVVIPMGRISAFQRLCAAMGVVVETME